MEKEVWFWGIGFWDKGQPAIYTGMAFVVTWIRLLSCVISAARANTHSVEVVLGIRGRGHFGAQAFGIRSYRREGSESGNGKIGPLELWLEMVIDARHAPTRTSNARRKSLAKADES